MTISLTTPALLFPAISLLLLAFTNRFLAIATLIRQLRRYYLDDPKRVLRGQLKNLRTRLYLIRLMQFLGVLSLFVDVLSMFFLYLEAGNWGSILFGVSLVTLLISLFVSMREIQMSTRALELELGDMELGPKMATKMKF